MAELFGSMNMMRGGGVFGGIMIADTRPPEARVRQTSKHSGNPVIANSTVEFVNGGSGFLIAVNHRTKANNTYVLGLIVTAAHVVCDIGTAIPSKTEFTVKLESGEACTALLLKEYSRLFTEEMHSETFGTENSYSIPGNAAILLLTSLRQEVIAHYEINECISVGNTTTISGYPKKPANLRYCHPQGAQLPNFTAIVNQAFQNFKGLVHSPGTISNMNNSLLEIACSTTSGMSGAPVIIDSKVAGIYLGGPPLIGQRILFKAIELIKLNQVPQAIEMIEDLRRYDYLYNGGPFTKLINRIDRESLIELWTMKNGSTPISLDLDNALSAEIDMIIKIILETIYQLILIFKSQEEITFNVALSSTHQLFQDIKERIIRFNNIQDRYTDIQEIISELSN